MELKYTAGVGALLTMSVLFLVLQGSGATITHDGDKICTNLCESTITIKMGGYDVMVDNFYLLTPTFSKEPTDFRLYLVGGTDESTKIKSQKEYKGKEIKKWEKTKSFIDASTFKSFTFRAHNTYVFKLVGEKQEKENLKWGFDFRGIGVIDPWWNSSSTILVNITPPYPTQWDTLNCSWNISNNDTVPYNASITWFINGTRNVSFDANRTNLLAGYAWSNVTISLNASLLYANFSCAVNLSNSTYSTGWIYSSNKTIMNFNVSLPTQRNESNISFVVSNVSLTCLDQFMNETQPDGQTHRIPIFNITARNNVNNITNITIGLGTNLTTNFELWASDTPFNTNNSVNLSTSMNVILKTLTGFNFTESQKGIWLYGRCFNVTENVTNNLSIIIAGGGG